MLATLSPMAFTMVAGGSTRVPIIVMIGKTSGGNPYSEMISSSPIVPPPGIPLTTVPHRMAMPIAVRRVYTTKKSMWNNPNKKAIFRIAARQEPSM